VNGLVDSVNHINPGSPVFDAKDAKLIVLSDLGLSGHWHFDKLGSECIWLRQCPGLVLLAIPMGQ